jgi:hypothetical protein
MSCTAGHFPEYRILSKILFTDECTIYRSTRDRNVVFWAKENPHFMVELEHNPPHVMLWAGMTATHLIGPYFFDGPVNTAFCAEMLEVLLIPQRKDRGLMEDVWLQHDGAPAHFTLTMCDILNEHFPGCWIGCSSPTSPARHYPGHHVVLILPDRTTLCAALSRDKWLRTVVTTITSCAELWNRRSVHHHCATNALAHVTQNMAAHQAVFQTGRCTYRSSYVQ